MVGRAGCVAVGVALLGVELAGAARADTGPWDAAVEAAAEAALARLGSRPYVAVVASVVDVVGLTSGVTGHVEEVGQAIRQLGAKESAREVHVELPAGVLFDFDKADIRADATTALTRVATIIRAYPSGGTTLVGHSDARGDGAYNQRLSERRAQSVRRWLIDHEHLDGTRLSARGLGERSPIASNATEAGRQRNRRVEVVIRKGR
jgi:outer membrane protein OmpA-like peptidoglycan-associated protein